MRIHILAIAGSMTTSLALALKNQGHQVSGSDQDKIFPPFSTQLLDSQIPVNSTIIDKTIDLCIVGSAYSKFTRCTEEFEKTKRLNILYISATEYLSQNLIQPESIVVAGTYGKTTTTCLLSFLFTKLNLNPNYFFGGQSVDTLPSLQFNKSIWSIIEGDESVNGLDTEAKFLNYRPKYLILTSAQWEHKESYPTAEDNFNAFKKLVELLPPDGILVYNPNDSEVLRLLPFSQATNIAYHSFNFETSLIGQHNQENICAVLTLIQSLNLDLPKSIKLIKDFHGVNRRLEIKASINNIVIIDDFAQSSERVIQSLKAIKKTYPKSNLRVYFEPHASFLQNKTVVQSYTTVFDQASEVILAQIKYSQNQDKLTRVTAKDYSLTIGPKLKYLPTNDDIFDYFANTLQPNDVLVHFSSGGLDGLNTLARLVAILNTPL